MFVNEILLFINLQQDGKIIETEHPPLYGHPVNKVNGYLCFLLPRRIQEDVLEVVDVRCHTLPFPVVFLGSLPA